MCKFQAKCKKFLAQLAHVQEEYEEALNCSCTCQEYRDFAGIFPTLFHFYLHFLKFFLHFSQFFLYTHFYIFFLHITEACFQHFCMCRKFFLLCMALGPASHVCLSLVEPSLEHRVFALNHVYECDLPLVASAAHLTFTTLPTF